MKIIKHRDYYYLSYYNEDKQRIRISTRSKDIDEAKMFLKEFKSNLNPRKQKINRIQPIVDQYLNYSKAVHSPKTFDTYKSVLKHFKEHFKDHFIQNICSRDLEEYILNIKNNVSAYSGRKYYRHISSFFEKVISWDYIKTNPFKKFKAPKLPEKIPAYFTEEEFKKLVSVMKSDFIRDIVFVAIYTGMRQAEIYNLRWCDIDFDKRIIKIQNSEYFTTKNERIRFIPMNDELYKILLNKHRYKTSDQEIIFYLFDRSYKSIRYYITHKFKEYIRKAGLSEKLHFHSLRHTFASWLVQRDTNIFSVMKLLGHSTISTTMIYTHLAPETLHCEVNKLNLLN